MTPEIDVRLIPTMVHGRVLVREAQAAAARGIVVGFHGYMESAAIQMERLEAIPGARAWTLVAVQALNRFYQGRTQTVVAGWMTREDREAAIADNINYVDAALDSVPHDDSTRVVYAGFSQGVAMAFRAAVRGRVPGAAVIAIGGDVPPELLADTATVFPPVLLARGERDEWFTQAKLDADAKALRSRGVNVRPFEYDGAHEWNDAVTRAAGEFLASLG
ncbi:MAG TPA: dienelactone hydrolase family protein [Vicinamibacterales bacterium]